MASAVAVAASTALAVRADAAAAVGRWFVTDASLAANAALSAATVGPLTLALVLGLHFRRDASARNELVHRNRHDALTGLPNRTALPALAARALRTTRDGTNQCAVLFCDLDRFKSVNDTYGHEIGDQLMIAVAARLRAELGEHQSVVRYGGDEFVVLAGDLRGPLDAERLAGRIVRSLQAPFEIGPDTVRISAAIGLALSGESGKDVDDLLRDADVAMYRAKAIGPGSVCAFDRSMRGRLTRAQAAAQLRTAVERGDIDLRFSPVLSVRDGSLVAVRATFHWEHEDHTTTSSAALVAALEEIGLIVPIGLQAIDRSCELARRWRELAPHARAVQVQVPVSARLLARASFRDQVSRALQSAGGRNDQLCLLVDDDTIDSDVTDTRTMLRHVRALGVHVVLDGFGAGRSSLNELRHARMDELALDGALVAGLDHEGEDATIIQHVIALAHELGTAVTASDVTTPRQLARLRRLGCDRAWGPFLGPPLTIDDVDVLVAATPSTVAPAPPTLQPSLPRLRPFGGPAAV